MTPLEIAKFWSQVKRTSGCWLWTGSYFRNKYGRFRVNGKSCLTHRLAFELINGYDPGSYCVLHHCDNPRCVNPAHLFTGTQKDNLIDMDKKGRRKNPDIRGSKNPNAKLTLKNVKYIKRSTKSNSELGKELGITPTQVGYIRRGKSWKL
jgi:hypothetical protein